MADSDATESETEREEDLQVMEVVELPVCTVDLSGSTATQDQEATSSVHVPSLLHNWEFHVGLTWLVFEKFDRKLQNAHKSWSLRVALILQVSAQFNVYASFPTRP